MASLSLKYRDRSGSDKNGRGNKCSSLNSPVILKKFSRSQKLRAEALGWDGWMKEPFETNQSLLSNFQFFVPDNQEKMEDFSANQPNFVPFDHDQVFNQSHHHIAVNAKEPSLNDNFVKSVPNLSSSVLLETNSSYFSTRKAIITISLPSSQILVVNFAACQLLNYRSDELCSMKLDNLVYDSYQPKWIKLKKNFFKDQSNIPYNNGKLIELIQDNGSTIMVSLYLKKLDNPQKCLVIAEPLDQKVAMVTIDHNGKILSYDEETCSLFQYDVSELIGVNISFLLPAINFNDNSEHHCRETYKQYITGKTKNQDNFPVCLTVNCNSSGSKIFQVVLRVYLNLNGLLILNKDLLVINCNHAFIKLLCGYSKKEIVNQSLINLIPSFGKDVRFDKMKNDNFENKLQIISNEEIYSNCWGKNDSFQENCDDSNAKMTLGLKNNSNPQELIIPLQKKSCSKTLFLQNGEEKIETDLTIDNQILEGKFFAFCKHKDGALIDIKYQVKPTIINEELQYYVYLYNDLQKFEDFRNVMNATITSSLNNTSFDSSLPDESVGSEHQTRPSPASVISQCDEILTAGEYCKFYTNIRQIGKGTFGYVKMAFRNSDGLLVVTKFIKKQKINIRSWVYHPNLNIKIPLEISLLITLQHPNIVKVIDVFHNDSFVQLVMEKHGAGFDLFEFIDRGPKCDEKLKSYIFRQIVSAVHYLDSLGILHRDIKDENVIINEKFQIKLIDFGSAAFMPPNETFSKFYGTMEYCSPEVLLGNSYRGPELEIWSLGVTLYVLTFGENPFYNVEETIKGKFSIPSAISKELNDLLHKMLDKNVETRITIKKLAEHEWINQPVCIDNYKFDEVVRCYEDEAYPPKYVSEIHVEKLFSRTSSQTDSEKIYQKTNSNNSLQNLTMDDLVDSDESFQESFKAAKLDSARQGKTTSAKFLFSTPLQKKDCGMSRSAVALRKHLENALPLKNSHSAKSRMNLLDNEISLNSSKIKHFNKSSPNLLESDMPKKSDNSLDNSNLELEIRFKSCYFDGEKDKENSMNNQRKYLIDRGDYLEDSEDTSDDQLVEEVQSTSQCFNPN